MNIKNINISAHAEIRAKQRGIPPMIIDLIIDFGTRIDRGDVCSVFFDKKAIKEVKRYGGPECLPLVNRYKDVYLILSENNNTVVTIAHKHKNRKFNHNGFRRNCAYSEAA